MAKECSICGKKLGFLAGKVAVSDGIVCDSCWFAAGLDLSINSMMTSNLEHAHREPAPGHD